LDRNELRKVGQEEPTIDGIDIAEFNTNLKLDRWLKKTAPVFVQK
jgi:hypothetical protein